VVGPTGKDLEAWRGEARQFVIETDVMLGSLFENGKGGVVFVGRARKATYTEIPPLHVETLVPRITQGGHQPPFEIRVATIGHSLPPWIVWTFFRPPCNHLALFQSDPT
jgi:hypothetical protein